MKRMLLLGALIGATIGVVSSAPDALAAGRKASPAEDSAGPSAQPDTAYHRTTAYRRKARRARRPIQVYVSKRGGYSYSVSDTLNTFAGDTRDPMTMPNRQTPAGPFDNGFFFDSPVAPNGGQSPYMH